MPIRPPEFDEAALLLEPLLHDLPPVVIAITGAMGVGKTTLGRFLAWYFNVTLIETDHYLKSARQSKYEVAEVQRIVELRLRIPRPVIVEGVAVIPLLAQLGLQPGFILQLLNEASRVRRGCLPKQRNPLLHGFGAVPTAFVAASH